MASEVDIVNTALTHLGDSAVVESISPPDGSYQADRAAVFYPMARDALQEMHTWGFCTMRAALAQVANPTSSWQYCYAQPPNVLNTIAVLAPDAADDTSSPLYAPTAWLGYQAPFGGAYTPQAFQLETADDGSQILYTNQVNAILRYTTVNTDTTKFSPLFTVTLGHFLASMLAGPIMKGDAGAAMAVRQMELAFGRDGKSGWFGKAQASDAGQKKITTRDRQQVAWINGR